MVEPRLIIRSGIAASAVVHLSLLAMILIYAEVHPFGSVTAEPIAVDIVSPEEAAPKPAAEPPAELKPSDAFDVSAKAASQPASAAPQPPAAPPPKQQAALSTPRPGRQQAAVQPPPPAASPAPAFVPPQPDLSIKYHVLLGLPQELPQGPPKDSAHDKPGDGFDAPASATADIASSFVAEFRRHLKTCSKLPQSINAADALKIKLRVLMTPEGKLAATPILIEASASAKGPLLMQSAVSALEACQPYAMLPADRYGEWKALDLNFTPQDFDGG
jgi:hypothetical protein